MRATLQRLGISIATAAALSAGLAFDADAYTAADKAGRGLAGVTTGFLEVPGNMVVESREHGAAYGMTVGLAKGLGGFVARELVGAYELVTSPFAVPSGYRPILRPEYPWDYFDEGRVTQRAPDDPLLASRVDERMF